MIRQDIGMYHAMYFRLIFVLTAAGIALLSRVFPGTPPVLFSLLAYPAMFLARRVMGRLVPIRIPAPISRRRLWIFIGATLALLFVSATILAVLREGTDSALTLLLGVPAAFCANLILTRWYGSKYYLIAWPALPAE